MTTPLIVIDMQPYFNSSRRPLNKVLEQVRKARKNGEPVFVVEYEGCGPSYDEIYDELDGYDQVVKVLKNDDGGGREIINAATKSGINIGERVRVVGVNRAYCVYETVEQLIELTEGMNGQSVKVDVVLGATWCSTLPTHNRRALKQLGCSFVRK